MIPAEIRPKKNISHFWASLATHPLISSSRALNRMGGHGVLRLAHTTLPRYSNTKQHRREKMRSIYTVLLSMVCWLVVGGGSDGGDVALAGC